MKKSEKELNETSKQNEESKRRAVVLNSTLNFSTRIPLMITSVNDFRLLIFNRFKNFDYEISADTLDELSPSFTFKLNCSNVKACLVFQSMGICF